MSEQKNSCVLGAQGRRRPPKFTAAGHDHGAEEPTHKLIEDSCYRSSKAPPSPHLGRGLMPFGTPGWLTTDSFVGAPSLPRWSSEL